MVWNHYESNHVIRIQNDLEELITEWSVSKLAKTLDINDMATRVFLYLYKNLKTSSLEWWSEFEKKTTLIQPLQNSENAINEYDLSKHGHQVSGVENASFHNFVNGELLWNIF